MKLCINKHLLQVRTVFFRALHQGKNAFVRTLHFKVFVRCHFIELVLVLQDFLDLYEPILIVLLALYSYALRYLVFC